MNRIERSPQRPSRVFGGGWSRRALAGTGVAALALGVPLASGSSAAPSSGVKARVVSTGVRGTLGTILVTRSGRTVYYDSADKPNVSTCYKSCAKVWPPLLMPTGKTIPTGVPGLGTIARADGKVQVTYNQMPLYLFVNDSGNSTHGNGVGGFFVVHPS